MHYQFWVSYLLLHSLEFRINNCLIKIMTWKFECLMQYLRVELHIAKGCCMLQGRLTHSYAWNVICNGHDHLLIISSTQRFCISMINSLLILICKKKKSYKVCQHYTHFLWRQSEAFKCYNNGWKSIEFNIIAKQNP